MHLFFLCEEIPAFTRNLVGPNDSLYVGRGPWQHDSIRRASNIHCNKDFREVQSSEALSLCCQQRASSDASRSGRPRGVPPPAAPAMASPSSSSSSRHHHHHRAPLPLRAREPRPPPSPPRRFVLPDPASPAVHARWVFLPTCVSICDGPGGASHGHARHCHFVFSHGALPSASMAALVLWLARASSALGNGCLQGVRWNVHWQPGLPVRFSSQKTELRCSCKARAISWWYILSCWLSDIVLNNFHCWCFYSGFLPTLEPGVSAVYLCRRARSTTCSVLMDDRSQGELDGAKVNYFLAFHRQGKIFMYNMGKH